MRLCLVLGLFLLVLSAYAEGTSEPVAAPALESEARDSEAEVLNEEGELSASDIQHLVDRVSETQLLDPLVAPSPECGVEVLKPSFRIILRKEWGAKPPRATAPTYSCGDYLAHRSEFGLEDSADPTRVLRKVYEGGRIIIHHTATRGTSIQSLQRMHQAGNGWVDVGYHFYVTRDGKVYEGRSLFLMGASAGTLPSHQKACKLKSTYVISEDFDFKSVGIALEGNYGIDAKVPEVQMEALRGLVQYLTSILGLATIHGHQHYRHGGTECPGRALMNQIKKEYFSKDSAPREDQTPKVRKATDVNLLDPRISCDASRGCE